MYASIARKIARAKFYAKYLKRYDSKRMICRKKHTVKRYGLTIEDYDKMSQAQKHVCAICRRPETVINKNPSRVNALSVDHCHLTGDIRGLLCSSCNRGIGYLGEDPNNLNRAARYLRRHFAKSRKL